MDHRKKVSVLVVLVVSMMLIVPIQPAKAQFVLSSWSFPDELGQGIYRTRIKENSTGSFIDIPNPVIGYYYHDNASDIMVNSTGSTALWFDVRIYFNYTYMGLSHPADNQVARDIIRISIRMSTSGETLFFQQNMTYNTFLGQVEPSIWAYSYVYLVDVLLVWGPIYIVTIIYEVFY